MQIVSYVNKPCCSVCTNYKSTSWEKFCFLIEVWLVRYNHILPCRNKIIVIEYWMEFSKQIDTLFPNHFYLRKNQ